MALQTSPEAPAAVRTVAYGLAGWLSKLGDVWVEGQLTDVSRRGSSVYGVLRDTDVDISLRFTCAPRTFDAVPGIGDGSRVLAHAKVDFFVRRGSLNLDVREFRHVGLGELLARLEHRKQLLAAEGLFAEHLKRRLPFLPGTVGLVCGRESAAERDVVENATARWPAVEFRIVTTAVQGPQAAADIMRAIAELDADPAVDVIVVARGGGSLEDLLAFSDEGLVRAVHRCRTPVVSAIGHETDRPLLDLVADVRASTPTDAAKRIVPDVADQHRLIDDLRARAARAARQRLDRETTMLQALLARPVLVTPLSDLAQRRTAVDSAVATARRLIDHRLQRADDDLVHQLARVRALSPRATLERGYAVVQDAAGAALRSVAGLTTGDGVRVRLSDGRFAATVTGDVDTDLDLRTTSSSTERTEESG